MYLSIYGNGMSTREYYSEIELSWFDRYLLSWCTGTDYGWRAAKKLRLYRGIIKALFSLAAISVLTGIALVIIGDVSLAIPIGLAIFCAALWVVARAMVNWRPYGPRDHGQEFLKRHSNDLIPVSSKDLVIVREACDAHFNNADRASSQFLFESVLGSAFLIPQFLATTRLIRSLLDCAPTEGELSVEDKSYLAILNGKLREEAQLTVTTMIATIGGRIDLTEHAKAEEATRDTRMYGEEAGPWRAQAKEAAIKAIHISP